MVALASDVPSGNPDRAVNGWSPAPSKPSEGAKGKLDDDEVAEMEQTIKEKEVSRKDKCLTVVTSIRGNFEVGTLEPRNGGSHITSVDQCSLRLFRAEL